MSRPPRTYRICCFDAALKIVSADWLNAATDEEAIAEAQARGFGSKCEIWDGQRLVAQLEERQQA